MKNSDLFVFAARFNPIRYETPERIYRKWVGHMLESGVTLVVIECQYGERPFVCEMPGVRHIGVRAQSPAWSKECLINIGINRTPEADNICWCDTDVFFEHPHWAMEALEALQLYRWIQPWSQAIDRGPHGEVLSVFPSFCHQYEKGEPLVPDRHGWKSYAGKDPHPGYCVVEGTIAQPLGAVHGASVRRYDGDVYVVHTAAGHHVSVTSNHPILSDKGWVAAAELRVGDHVFSARHGDGVAIKGDEKQVPTAIEDITRSLSESPNVRRAALPTGPEHFHGDGVGSKVAVVWSDGLLRDISETQLIEEARKDQLGRSAMGLERLLSQRSSALLFERLRPPSPAINRIPGCRDDLTLLECRIDHHSVGDSLPDLRAPFLRVAGPSHSLGGRHGADRNSSLFEPLANSPACHADNLADFRGALAGKVERDRIVKIDRVPFSGHVYNLSTKRGAYLANNIVTHNCHASTRRVLEYCGGLFELGGMGASDHAMCLSLVGNAKHAVHHELNPDYLNHLLRWQARIQHATNGRIGYSNGVIDHAFHGAKAGRQYLSRWEMFLRHDFTPTEDLMRNTFGVLEFSGNKPELIRDWLGYLKSRNEDGNVS